MTQAQRLRVGVDVGGTFTDFVLSDPADGRLLHHKERSDPADPSAPVARGLAALLALAGEPAGAIETFVHGTTLGLNAILQHRGARLGLVVSRGNRDVLEIARSRMPAAYDVFGAREPPLVPRDRVFEIAARMVPDGTIIEQPSGADLDALAAKLTAARVDAVAIMLINSYRDGALERQIGAALAARLPGLAITCSADIWPEIREYERALVATLNAFIHPTMAAYFDRLERRLRDLGVTGTIAIAGSNGGTIGIDTARVRPIETILSGPAAGAAAAARLAATMGIDRALTIDMGGTSSDMAVIENGRPAVTTVGRIGDYPLILPMVGVDAIGAGGGSIAHLDAQGVLKVGPQSAGADPGPACYGRGGIEATVTDAYVATGIVPADNFLGGRMTLDPGLATAALDRLAAGLNLTGPDRAVVAGAAVLRVATAKMAVELSKQLAVRGLDPRLFALIAFGGAGATHATLLAAEAGLGSVVIPPVPGTFCALGGVMADPRRDFAATLRVVLDGGTDAIDPIARTLRKLETDAEAWVRTEAAARGVPAMVRALDLHYPAQAHELTIPLPPGRPDGPAIRQAFHDAHRRLYGFADTASAVQVNTVRLSATLAGAPWQWPVAATGSAATPIGTRPVFHDGRWIDVPRYSRMALGTGASFFGPAIVEQADTTIWILPGWSAQVDAIGCLRLTATAR